MNQTLVNEFLSLNVRENVELKKFSTLRVGGPARFFAQPQSLEEVAKLQLLCIEHQLPWHVLSGGSNTLFADEGFLGLVIKLGSSFDFITPNKDGTISVGASASYAKLTKIALDLGWAKALGWCGTPGLVGGAIRMNAGTRLGEMKDGILSVTGVQNGQVLSFAKKDIEFAYRKSTLPKDLIICQAELGTESFDSTALLRAQVSEYREKRRKTQPAINSLGSFFKNPSNETFAGQLIEQCGLKGFQYKDAELSRLHANFIINNKNASAKDILHVASIAQKTVLEKCGILLEPEVRMVGFKSNPLL